MADATRRASWCSARAVILLEGDACPSSPLASAVVLVSQDDSTMYRRSVDGVFSHGALQRVADCCLRAKG